MDNTLDKKSGTQSCCIKKLKHLDVSQVTGELQKLTTQINPALIHLLDSSISPSLLAALAQKPTAAPWYGFARVTKHLTNEDFCLSLKNSGCTMLKLGIESGDQQALDQLNKGIDLPTASSVLKKTNAGYFTSNHAPFFALNKH